MRLVKLELLRSSVHYVTEEPAARNTTGPEIGAQPPRSRFDARMADNRTISQLEAEGYPWIGCELQKGLGAVQDAPQTDSDAQRYAD